MVLNPVRPKAISTRSRVDMATSVSIAAPFGAASIALPSKSRSGHALVELRRRFGFRILGSTSRTETMFAFFVVLRLASIDALPRVDRGFFFCTKSGRCRQSAVANDISTLGWNSIFCLWITFLFSQLFKHIVSATFFHHFGAFLGHFYVF